MPVSPGHRHDRVEVGDGPAAAGGGLMSVLDASVPDGREDRADTHLADFALEPPERVQAHPIMATSLTALTLSPSDSAA